MDVLVMLAIQECQNMFKTLSENCYSDEYIIKYGIYPQTAIIRYHDKYSVKDLCPGNTIKAWKIGMDFINELVDLSIKCETRPISGMYFPEGQFYFAISDDKQSMILSMYLGPRYGQGYSFSIEPFNDNIILTKKKLLWVS